MPNPFFAMIVPLGAGPHPEHPIYNPPPGGGGGGGAHPEHPITYPPSIWGPPTMPPGFWGGGMGPGVSPQPPTGGGQPPGIWGPTDPRPGNPISGIPGMPGAPGQQPGGIWGGGNQPFPTPPIHMPPGMGGGGGGGNLQPLPPDSQAKPGAVSPPIEGQHGLAVAYAVIQGQPHAVVVDLDARNEMPEPPAKPQQGAPAPAPQPSSAQPKK